MNRSETIIGGYLGSLTILWGMLFGGGWVFSQELSIPTKEVSPPRPTLQLVNYRGPGTLDRDLGPLAFDGNPQTEWKAAGLSKTTLGPPFEFELEFHDGASRDLAGIRILSADKVAGHRLKSFEIRMLEGEGKASGELIYQGEQASEAVAQTHLFQQPIRVRRFQFKYVSNHGDPDHATLHEVWPIFNASETAVTGTLTLPPGEGISLAVPEPADQDYVGSFPYDELQEVPVPKIVEDESLGSIDTWLLSSLREKGLDFSPPATREVLLRRVTYDLIGLPPLPEELDAFLADSSEDAYEKVVERLLSDPRFGERWAQHWLDLVLYADTDGYAADGVRKDAWRYRDYVIQAFNADKPYDQFVREQLAADELQPLKLDALPALGFLRMAPFRTNSGNQNFERNRQELLTGMTDAVGSVFFGMTIGCARCHDHKLDPIPQTDYYRLQAYLAAAEPVQLPMADEETLRRWQEETDRGNALLAENRLRQGAIRGAARTRRVELNLAEVSSEVRAALLTVPEKRSEAEKKLIQGEEGRLVPSEEDIAKVYTVEEKSELEQLKSEEKQLVAKLPAQLPEAWGVRDAGVIAPTAYVYHRGQVERKKAFVLPRVPSVLPHAELSQPVDPSSESASTGRRKALADWLVGPGRTQTARVMANRIWQHHFGQGIVSTPNDFGNMGAPPTHPELLNWMAGELIRGGWSLKNLHRQIVLSLAYRQSSASLAEALEIDSANDLLWRFPRRRLSAEEIRDSVLFFSGRLNFEKGGPGVTLPQPAEVLRDIKNPWRVTSDPAQHLRRSIYLFVERKLRIPLLEVFDQPDTMTSCSRRSQSTHALQSLALLNNEWIRLQAVEIGRRILAENDATKVQLAYRQITGRRANPEEERIALEFLARHREFLSIQKTDKAAVELELWGDFSQVLLNLNRFLYID